ncbi:hypothetical protein IE81DRAFT_350463 [Ceraceosorus guamensis]|uniref:Fatty acid hydroxylase domain-containing protein n=1 Tax=Ceraceosorus guamensis TaxID=1522189 RepID=A0A316VNA7_9BASI|nr:hypothetical protein IE81DRAFT_350463 [Ceraceosorus guamensis]PWN39119.1 hypothetical protein IE81DRAFT_350463 [Ceraceosorus guamensis]
MNFAIAHSYKTNWQESWPHASGATPSWSTWLISTLGMYPLPPSAKAEASLSDSDAIVQTSQPSKMSEKPIPRMRSRDLARWLIPRAFAPVALHALFAAWTQQAGHPLLVFVFYSAAFKLIAINTIQLFRELGNRHGFLDGQKKRDGIPDDSVGKIAMSLINTAEIRSAMVCMLAWDSRQKPRVHWMLPFQIAAYPLILDFWFYWYHRAMHEIGFLWRFHRTHHLTRHPNAMLSLFADAEQELFDIALIPMLTYYTMSFIPHLSLNFYDWFLCGIFVMVIELGGHSGVRIIGTPPAAAFGLLPFLGLELVIEDHDLHHRRGWKRSGNYGKQTRVWDKLFGTCLDRVECPENSRESHSLVKVPW